MDRSELRDDLTTALRKEQRAALDDPGFRPGNGGRLMWDLVQHELVSRGVKLDDRELRTLRWLCDTEVDTVATIVALMVEHREVPRGYFQVA